MAGPAAVYRAKRAAALTGLTGGTAAIVLSNDSSSYGIFVMCPEDSRLNGIPFKVRASGIITGGAGGTSTFLPGIYYSATANGSSPTLTAGNLVAGVASTALSASTSYPWRVEADLIWDSTSQAMGGTYWQYVGIASGTTTQAVVINLLGSIDLSVAGAGFNVGITMGTTRTGATCTVKDFVLEVQ